MIYSVLLISKGGVPIYKKVLRRLPIPSEKFDEESLVASIITAVIGMSQEVFGQRISSFSLENLEVSIGASEKAIVAVISDKGDEEAIKMGKAILSKIDTLLDYPDFEDGLVLSTAADRVEEFINSIVKEIGSPITKSISILEDFLMICERDGVYKRITKEEIEFYSPTTSIFGILKTRIGGKEKEIVQEALHLAMNLDFDEGLNKLLSGFSNSYWGNMARLLFVKLGLIMHTLDGFSKVPTMEYLNNVIGEIKLEPLKEKGNIDDYNKLSLMRDFLYKQLTSLSESTGFQTEIAYFQSNRSRFREILLKSEDELERKLITLLITPLSSSLATLKLLNRNWKELSSYFLESWFSIDRYMAKRYVEVWEELYNLLTDITRVFYGLKRWNDESAYSILPIFIELLGKINTIKEMDITYLKDQIWRLLDIWDRYIYSSLSGKNSPMPTLLHASALGSLILGILHEVSSDDEKNKLRSTYQDKILSLAERGVRAYLVKKIYPEVIIIHLPMVIYYMSTLCSEDPNRLSTISGLIEVFNETMKRKVASGEDFSVNDTIALGMVMASIKNYYKVIKSNMDREKLLSAGSETLEYIRTRLKALKMDLDAGLFIQPVIEFYALLVSITREKSLADLVLLRSISMAEETEGVNLNQYLINRAVLMVFDNYIRRFGPMVPRWQKPIKVCDQTVEILRKLKSPEKLVAETWGRCSEIRRLINQ